jgi:predicted ATPase
MPTTHDSNGLDERTKPAFLRQVSIRGYKSLAFCNVPLQPLTILVGRNGSGKSNFLDALAFLRDVIRGGVQWAVKERGPWSSLICKTASHPVLEFAIEAAFTCGHTYRNLSRFHSGITGQSGPNGLPNLEGQSFIADYRLELAEGSQNVPTIAREYLTISDTANQPIIYFESNGDGSAINWRSFSNSPLTFETGQIVQISPRPGVTLLGSLGVQPFLDLAAGLDSMGIYNLHPNSMRLLQAPSPGTMLREDGSNLASLLKTTEEVSPEAVRQMQDYLTVIAPEIESFRHITYGDYETVRFGLRDTSSKSVEFDAASMSDGTLRVLGALAAAFQVVLPHGHPSVIGIEEAETSLHPAATHALISALEAATEHTQVLLTTHSGDLLADPKVSPSSVLVVRRREGRTEIAPVDPASREIIRQELYTLADLQRMGQLNPDEEHIDRSVGTLLLPEE